MTANERKDAGIVPEVTVDAATGMRIRPPDVPSLDRVLTAPCADDGTAFPVPHGYLSGADGNRIRRRAQWRFDPPPEQFGATLVRLRRLTGIVPGVSDADNPAIVTGGHLSELADALEVTALLGRT
jgi:hypothetical protein